MERNFRLMLAGSTMKPADLFFQTFFARESLKVLQWARVPCKLLSARTVMTMVL